LLIKVCDCQLSTAGEIMRAKLLVKNKIKTTEITGNLEKNIGCVLSIRLFLFDLELVI